MRISDWSSDVCSSDLEGHDVDLPAVGHLHLFQLSRVLHDRAVIDDGAVAERERGVRADDRRPVDPADPDRDHDLRDRKSVVYGKSVSVRVDLGGSRIIKKKKNN